MKPKDIEALISALEDFQSASRPVSNLHHAIMTSVGELYTDLLLALDRAT